MIEYILVQTYSSVLMVVPLKRESLDCENMEILL